MRLKAVEHGRRSACVLSYVTIQHKTEMDLRELSVAQLRARRRRLARALRNAETTMLGALVTQGRRCGREGCRCAKGELHGPYVYITFANRAAAAVCSTCRPSLPHW